MKRSSLLIGVLAALGVSEAAATSVKLPAEDLIQHKAFCGEKWTKRGVLDEGMFYFCMDNAHEGYLQYADEANRYGAQPWIQPVVDWAIHKWTKHGIRDDEMVAYELHQQTDAFEDLKYDMRQPSLSQDKLTACFNQYGLEFTMVEYCYKRD
jgi:hypothetical protein